MGPRPGGRHSPARVSSGYHGHSQVLASVVPNIRAYYRQTRSTGFDHPERDRPGTYVRGEDAFYYVTLDQLLDAQVPLI